MISTTMDPNYNRSLKRALVPSVVHFGEAAELIVPCICLSRGLYKESKRCPKHKAPIGNSQARPSQLIRSRS